jgi:hypothetical protein
MAEGVGERDRDRLQVLVHLRLVRPRGEVSATNRVQLLVQHPRGGVQVAKRAATGRRCNPVSSASSPAGGRLQGFARLQGAGRQLPQGLADHRPVVAEQADVAPVDHRRITTAPG